jgi:cytochrome c-type biogenesis protein CcmH/NrfG
VNLAATLASESHFDEAESTLKQALEIEPENIDALELQAMIKAGNKR